MGCRWNKQALVVAGFAALAVAAQPLAAQLFFTDPDFKAGQIEGSDPLVGLPIPGATATEHRAHLLWNMRAGLNVAALQCQFSPSLRLVPNYNGILAHHSGELATAYTTMVNYFKRVHGAREGQKLFDDYTTITYNNWSTLQAQMGFCQTAANIAKEALARPKGELQLVAHRRMRELRNSLVPAYDRAVPSGVYNPQAVQLPTLPPLDDRCWTKRNQLRPRCQAGATR